MRIRTNATEADMHAAAESAGVTFAKFSAGGSRTHAHGYDVTLSGSSTRRANGGYGGAIPDGYAATWDEWGVFLAAIYKDRADFDYQTGGRYWSEFAPCPNHQWSWSAYGGRAECAKGCGAVRVMERVG